MEILLNHIGIVFLEKIQRRAKNIFNDLSSDYRARLISLHLLPLMYLYEPLDISFFCDESLPMHLRDYFNR